jgi:O-antigen ligase
MTQLKRIPTPRGERGTERRAPQRLDAAFVLTVYFVLLYVVPSDRTIAPLGAAGSPAVLFGVLSGVWWAWYQLSRTEATRDGSHRPIRTAFFIFLAAVVVSYIVAMQNPHSPVEISGADIGILRVLSFAGVLLIANDGIRNRARLLTLLRRLVLAGSLFAALGLVQFVTKQSLVSAITIPGFTATQDFSAVQDRSGFARAAATATNPLEYAFVLSMILPIALTLAFDDTSRSAVRRWTPAILIVGALALSGSRSAVVGLIIGLLVLFPSWSVRARRWFVAITPVGVVAIYVLVPGMIGSVRYLFLNVGQDSSSASRTGSYEVALGFIERSPFFGRGFGTFLPHYRILDIQFLLTAIELGVVGLAALLGLLITALLVVWRGRVLQTDRLARQLGQALIASIAAGTLMTAFFDDLSFRMSAGTLFLVIGLCGAYWRLYGQRSQPEGVALPRDQSE